jgi:hypothetical protein
MAKVEFLPWSIPELKLYENSQSKTAKQRKFEQIRQFRVMLEFHQLSAAPQSASGFQLRKRKKGTQFKMDQPFSPHNYQANVFLTTMYRPDGQ